MQTSLRRDVAVFDFVTATAQKHTNLLSLFREIMGKRPTAPYMAVDQLAPGCYRTRPASTLE